MNGMLQAVAFESSSYYQLPYPQSRLELQRDWQREGGPTKF